MNIIGCLDVPTSGEYLLNGRNVGKMSGNALAEIRNKMIGFIFQQYNLLPKLSVRENVEVPLLYAGLPKKVRRERALEVLERVGLSGKPITVRTSFQAASSKRVAIAGRWRRPSVIRHEPRFAGLKDGQRGHRPYT